MGVTPVMECTHADGYGSTIVFVEGRPQDGICLLCDATFPALRLLRDDTVTGRKDVSAVMPVRIQRSRARGWRMPPGAVYVGRPSRWGNPHRVGDGPFFGRLGSPYAEAPFYLDENLVIGAFERWTVHAHLEADPAWLDPLRGHDLVCWCPLDKPCHADVLLELANR